MYVRVQRGADLGIVNRNMNLDNQNFKQTQIRVIQDVTNCEHLRDEHIPRNLGKHKFEKLFRNRTIGELTNNTDFVADTKSKTNKLQVRFNRTTKMQTNSPKRSYGYWIVPIGPSILAYTYPPPTPPYLPPPLGLYSPPLPAIIPPSRFRFPPDSDSDIGKLIASID